MVSPASTTVAVFLLMVLVVPVPLIDTEVLVGGVEGSTKIVAEFVLTEPQLPLAFVTTAL